MKVTDLACYVVAMTCHIHVFAIYIARYIYLYTRVSRYFTYCMAIFGLYEATRPEPLFALEFICI